MQAGCDFLDGLDACNRSSGAGKRWSHAVAITGYWCERGESNPHEPGPLDPKSSASTNFATLALTFN